MTQWIKTNSSGRQGTCDFSTRQVCLWLWTVTDIWEWAVWLLLIKKIWSSVKMWRTWMETCLLGSKPCERIISSLLVCLWMLNCITQGYCLSSSSLAVLGVHFALSVLGFFLSYKLAFIWVDDLHCQLLHGEQFMLIFQREESLILILGEILVLACCQKPWGYQTRCCVGHAKFEVSGMPGLCFVWRVKGEGVKPNRQN